MSAIRNFAGAFDGVYVGVFGASSVLQRVSNQRTNGSDIDIKTPTEYVVATNNYEISGPTTWSFSLTFYTDTDIPFRLARRLDPSASLNSPPDIELKYVVLLTRPSPQLNYLFKEVQTEISYNPNQNKDKPTELTVNFMFSNLDPNYDGYEFGTISELAAILGPRSPV